MNKIKCPLCETETTEEKLYDARVLFLTEKEILQRELKEQLEKSLIEMANTRKSNLLTNVWFSIIIIIYIVILLCQI